MAKGDGEMGLRAGVSEGQQWLEIREYLEKVSLMIQTANDQRPGHPGVISTHACCPPTPSPAPPPLFPNARHWFLIGGQFVKSKQQRCTGEGSGLLLAGGPALAGVCWGGYAVHSPPQFGVFLGIKRIINTTLIGHCVGLLITLCIHMGWYFHSFDVLPRKSIISSHSGTLDAWPDESTQPLSTSLLLLWRPKAHTWN